MYILAENIDIATMALLQKEEIKCLFPLIGDRVRFETSLSMYKKDQNQIEVDSFITVSDFFTYNFGIS